MKKLLKSLLVISMVVLISGCGDKKEEVQNQGETPKQEATEKTYKCSLTSNDVVNGYKLESLYEIYAKDDVVKKVVTEEKVTSEDNGKVLRVVDGVWDKAVIDDGTDTSY